MKVNGKMLCWETMVEEALEKSNFWRADLMTEKAWSLHPGDRSQKFYDLLLLKASPVKVIPPLTGLFTTAFLTAE